MVGFSRIAELGRLAGPLARIRSEDAPEERRALAEEVSSRLGLLHGLPQKIGQLLSVSRLEDEDDPFGALAEKQHWDFDLSKNGLAALSKRLGGKKVFEAFHELDGRCINASIGTVYSGTLRDGRHVAVKLQHEGIREAVETDLKALKWLAAPLAVTRGGFSINAFRNEIGRHTGDELDYRKEARWSRRFSDWMAALARTSSRSDGSISVRWEAGLVIGELCNDRVLTSHWVEGGPIAEAARWPVAYRQVLAEGLLELFFHSLFRWGVVHADPNPGNYRLRRKGDEVVIGLIDFGCVVEISDGLRAALLRLFTDAETAVWDEESALAFHGEMGFSAPLLEPMKGVLPAVLELLSEPFQREEEFLVEDWRLRERLAAVLGAHRMSYRMAGAPSSLYLLRAFQGLVAYLRRLRVPVNWGHCLRRVTETAEATKSTAPVSGLPSIQNMKSERKGRMQTSANALKVRVMEGTEKKVELTFPAAVVEHLEDLVPAEHKGRLVAQGILLDELAQEVLAAGCLPGEIFSSHDGNKEVRVWLES